MAATAAATATSSKSSTNGRNPNTQTCWDAIEMVKYTLSILLLVFSIVLVMGCIFTGQSIATDASFDDNTRSMHPIIACILFWVLICWLAIMEGGQGCLVGLKPIPVNKYCNTHPKTYQSCSIVHRNDGSNLERFIIGRQFLVVVVIFLINNIGEAIPNANPYPNLLLPAWVNMLFLENGIAMMITTIDVAQLPAQVNAAVSMLDFINNYIMVGTTYMSLLIEFSGLLHAVYLIQYGFELFVVNKNNNDEIKRNEIDNNVPKRAIYQTIFFWFRVVVSLCILGFALAVTVSALLEGKSGITWNVSPGIALIIFFVLLCLVGLMEGLQIAAFALMNMPENELKKHTIAYQNCSLLFDGTNLQSFLVGRQIFVASLMFIVARIVSIQIDKENNPDETNIFNVSDTFQQFLDTGLLGAVILTILGSLVWRVIASSFPLLYMQNPIIYIIIRACFILEATGICSVAWIIAIAVKSVFRLNRDDTYLGKTNSDGEDGGSTGLRATAIDGEGNDDDKSATAITVEYDPMFKPVGLRSSFVKQTRRRSSIMMKNIVNASEGEDGSEHQGQQQQHQQRQRRSSSIITRKSLLINDDVDDMKTQLEKMRNSMVFSSRLSSVMTKKDLDLVMEELDDDKNDDDDDDHDVNNNNPNNNVVDGRTPEEVEEGKRNNDFLLFVFIFVLLLNQSLFILFISFLYFPLLIQKHTQDTRITQYYVNYRIFLKRSM